MSLEVSRKVWCRRRESNPRPRDYETLALPLSYAGTKTILNATESVANVSSIPAEAAVRWHFFFRVLWEFSNMQLSHPNLGEGPLALESYRA